MTERVPFGEFQNEVYLAGLGGRRPDLPMSAEELEARAAEAMSPEAHGYVSGGAGSERTMRANREAFDRWRILPRMLRDVGARSLRVRLFGTELPAPVLLAPVGVQSIAHPEGELAVARAAASTGVGMVLSTASSFTLEEVAEANGGSPRWFQLYWPADRELAASFLSRAERAGFTAVVVTLDTWLLGWRPRDLANAYLPFLHSVGIANYLADPVFRASLPETPEENPMAAVLRFGQVFSDPTVTWDDLAFIREHTSLPILLKGIQHPDDARAAADRGMDGVIVSNHGGRQIDGAVGALDALPAVARSVGETMPVLFDSGIRTGSDVLKALALGARAVLVGRPYVWGLALAGEEGVRHVIRCLLAELDLTMALAGQTDASALDPSIVVRSIGPEAP